MKANVEPIKSIMDIEDILGYLTCEYDKLTAALLALRDFCKIDSVDPENVTPYNNMTLCPEQFYGLNDIVFDYVHETQTTVTELYHAVEQYRIEQHKSA